jgi:hypothetical protein
MPTKDKKSFTLSRSSVAFLERLRKEKKAPSIPLVLDDLIRDVEARQRRSASEQAITAFYDSLSSDEMKEHQAWGEFALSQWKETT